MRQLCMPQGLSPEELPKLEALICTARSVQRGEALYRNGDRFDNIYAVRSGSMKTLMAHRDGREQVTGLRLAGEALGLDGISEDVHACSAAGPGRQHGLHRPIRRAQIPLPRDQLDAGTPA